MTFLRCLAILVHLLISQSGIYKANLEFCVHGWELSTVDLTPGFLVVPLGFLSWAGQILPRRNLSCCHLENKSLAFIALGIKWGKETRDLSILYVTLT